MISAVKKFTLFICVGLTLSLSSKLDDAARAKLETYSTKLTAYVDLVTLEQLKADKKIFTAARSLERELSVLKLRGKFLSTASKEKSILRVEELESLCNEMHTGLENLHENFTTITSQLVQLLNEHGLLAQKYENFLVDETQIITTKPEVEAPQNAFELQTSSPRINAITIELAGLIALEQQIAENTETLEEIKKIVDQICEEKNQLKNIERRLAINPKSHFIAEKICEAKEKTLALEQTKTTLLAKIHQNVNTASLPTIKEDIQEKKRLLHEELEQIKLGKNLEPVKAIKKTKIDKVNQAETSLVANLNKLLDKAIKGHAWAEKMLQELLTAQETITKIKTFF